MRTAMNATFELHPQLAADCRVLGDLPLCRVLLMDDALYPWTILVPRRAGLREIYQLQAADQEQFWRESGVFSKALMELFAGEKLNVAALGNMVPQLHVHHIVRRAGDAAWPKPVWGQVPRQPYTPDILRERSKALMDKLDAVFGRDFSKL